MGLSNTGGGVGSKFVTIGNGKFSLRLQEGDDNPLAVERVLGEKSPKAGQTIRELLFNKLDGDIVAVELKEGNYGVDLCFDILDKGEKFKLQVPLKSGYFGQVVKRLPNVDANKPIEFHIGTSSETGKNFMWIVQDGQTCKMAYTKEEPNGMPPWGKKMDMGKEVDDPSKQENFLYGVAVDWLAGLDEGGTQTSVAPEAPADFEEPEEEIAF